MSAKSCRCCCCWEKVQNRGLEARYGHGPLHNYLANDKLRLFPLMISDLRGQGHSGLPLQPLQSLEKFLLLFYQILLIDQMATDDRCEKYPIRVVSCYINRMHPDRVAIKMVHE